MDEKQCLNCSNYFTGNYCNNCGEKVYNEHDKSFVHLFEEVFHFLTHFDSSYFRSVELMFVKPGRLAFNYCRGVRKKYFKPVSLYVMLVVLYLIFPLANGLNMPLENYQGQHLFGNFAEKKIVEKQEGEQIDFETLKEKFEHTSGKVSKLLLLVVLPLSALMMQLLYINKKSYYFFDHFILAAEINSFFILVYFFIIPLILRGISSMFNTVFFNKIDELAPLLILLVIVYTAIVFKRFYKSKWPGAILKSVLFVPAQMFIVFIIYKFLLFATVISLV